MTDDFEPIILTILSFYEAVADNLQDADLAFAVMELKERFNLPTQR